jgi:hypothetical protein
MTDAHHMRRIAIPAGHAAVGPDEIRDSGRREGWLAPQLYDDPKLAVRSQYWMLAVMVGFTSVALWLLSQRTLRERTVELQ